ncbi:MAG: DUF3078 domain-containing protein [Chitinophagaceae bacterium]|nr:DUF3078 domain-containing protein [Chitinophagaceae bacterium]
MKKTLLALALMTYALGSYGQRDKESDKLQGDLKTKVEAKNEGWSKSGLINIGLTQGMLENWAAGGERLSLAVNGQFNGIAARVKGNKVWENTCDLFYGLNYVESNAFKPRKIDDRIDVSSRYGLQPKKWTVSKNRIKRNTYLMGLFRFQSQFTPGYDYSLPNYEAAPISEFMSPAYFTLALGAEYRGGEKFSLFFSPIAAKFTTVHSNYTVAGPAFGVPKGKTNRLELGAYLTARYKTNLTSNVLYSTRLDLYSNYLAKNTVENGLVVRKDNPGNIDILWDNFFAIKISKFIGAGLGVTFLYDNDQPGQKTKTTTDANGIVTKTYGPLGWIQLKQVLNVGFSYKF